MSDEFENNVKRIEARTAQLLGQLTDQDKLDLYVMVLSSSSKANVPEQPDLEEARKQAVFTVGKYVKDETEKGGPIDESRSARDLLMEYLNKDRAMMARADEIIANTPFERQLEIYRLVPVNQRLEKMYTPDELKESVSNFMFLMCAHTAQTEQQLGLTFDQNQFLNATERWVKDTLLKNAKPMGGRH